jgi:hypothetical protein
VDQRKFERRVWLVVMGMLCAYAIGWTLAQRFR